MPIEDAQRFRVRDGDAVVVTVPLGTDPQEMEKIAQAVDGAIPKEGGLGYGMYRKPAVQVLITPYPIRVVRGGADAALEFVRAEAGGPDA